MTIMQVVKQLSKSQRWLPDWMRQALAKVKPYGSGRLCSSKNVIGQFTGLAYLSLQGTRFLAYTRNRLRNIAGEAKEIATPRQVGARNDKRAWRWISQAAIKIWGRDLQELVSSLVLAVAGEASLDLSYCPVCHAGQGWGRKANEHDYYLCPWNILCKEGDGRSWAINNTSNISGVDYKQIK